MDTSEIGIGASSMKLRRVLGSCIAIGGVALVILGLVALFGGWSFFGKITSPSLMKEYTRLEGAPEFTDSLGRHLGIGDTVTLKLDPRFKSIGGRYAVTELRFSPSQLNVAAWSGKTASPVWGELLVDGSKRVRGIPVEIQIPDDSTLEGRTVQGTVTAEVVFPKKTKPGEFRNVRLHLEQAFTLHIYSAESLVRLASIELSVRESRRAIMHWLFFVGLGLLVLASGLYRSGDGVVLWALPGSAYIGINCGLVCVRFVEANWLETPNQGGIGLFSLLIAIASFIVPAAVVFLFSWVGLSQLIFRLFGIKNN